MSREDFGMARATHLTNGLFVSQSIDGIELRRFAGGIKAKENAHGGAADERKNDRLGRNQSRPILDGSDQPRAANAHSNAQQAADGAQGYGFDKKLQENVAATCPHGNLDTDIASVFRDA